MQSPSCNFRKSFPNALRLLYLFNKRQRASRLNGDGFDVNRDRFRDRVSNGFSPAVDFSPTGFAAARIDFEELYAVGHLGSITDNTSYTISTSE